MSDYDEEDAKKRASIIVRACQLCKGKWLEVGAAVGTSDDPTTYELNNLTDSEALLEWGGVRRVVDRNTVFDVNIACNIAMLLYHTDFTEEQVIDMISARTD